MRVQTISVVIVASFVMCGATTSEASSATPSRYEQVAQTSAGSEQMTPSEEDAKRRLESAGYTDVTNVKAGSEVLSAKAVKDGKKVNIIIDTFGKIIATPAE